MPEKYLTIEQVLTLLAETPKLIAASTYGLEPEPLRASPNPGEWSVNEVLAHLRACADMWGGCIVEIINKDRPTLRAVNPRTWIKQTDYLEQEFQPSLQAFTAQRNDLLSILEALAPEDWSRSAMVKGAGKVLERTVLFYAQWLATHEQPHVKQIHRIVNAVKK